MQNKRGQGLSTSAIILIVLGVIVLAILAVGFIFGWEKIAFWIDSDNNVDMIAQACHQACIMNLKYDFCVRERQLEAKDLPDEAGKEITFKKASCNFFATDDNYKKYGIEPCESITC